MASTVRNEISASQCLVADVTVPNFNVTYEVGFAVGGGKTLLLVRDASVTQHIDFFRKLGIFDTLGCLPYQNSSELAEILETCNPTAPLSFVVPEVNRRSPVYLLDAKFKTDQATRIVSRVKKARLSFRSFDPAEQARLNPHDTIRQVAQSLGVLVHLIPSMIEDAPFHNLRAAFIAGLADGMDKVSMILQDGDEPVPLDYRDFVVPFKHPNEIDQAIADFAPLVSEALQRGVEPVVKETATFLARLSLGATAAENELRDLGEYYLPTDAYQRAARGDVRLALGRKGSGKTALFVQLRDTVRRDPQNIVLDLKPDGYKLRRFKEDILSLLQAGTAEHTITALWEYLLLLETSHKLLEKDHLPHTRDPKLYAPYQRLSAVYHSGTVETAGDFSERISVLLDRIRADYFAIAGRDPGQRLSASEVTGLVYRHDLRELRDAVQAYLQHKKSLWLLFDNIDKGWPPNGLQPEDALIVRCLLDATRKLERFLQRSGIEAHTIVFLRNDVYDMLIQETPDRGKESRVLIDWTDPDLFRELIRRRLVFGGLPEKRRFEELWVGICVSHVRGEESFDFLAQRSLMRPRGLLELLNHCKGSAVNLRHERIEAEDLEKGLSAYSTELVVGISLEIRDLLPRAENALYCFIGEGSSLGYGKVMDLLRPLGLDADQTEVIVDTLLWYGVLGIVRSPGDVAYVYHLNYDMQLLRGLIRKVSAERALLHVNPAFWPALAINA